MYSLHDGSVMGPLQIIANRPNINSKQLTGILFHSFAPILEKEFFIWSVLEHLI